MRILIIILFSTLTVFGQYGGNKTGGYGGQGFGGSGTGQRFSAVDLDGSSEYMYRNYAVADSFLNLNGYERTQLPQSTMKVGFSGVAITLPFTNATDTNYVPTFTRDSANVISGGKLQMRLGGVDGSGIRTSFVLTAGTVYYVKFKIRWVNGTRVNISVYNGFGAVPPQGVTTFPTSEETNYEFTTIGRGDRLYFVAIDSCLYQTYEIDDIEVREVSNSVTNGTFTGGLTNWTPTGTVADSSNSAKFTGDASTTAQLLQSLGTTNTGRRWILTFQTVTSTISTTGKFAVFTGSSAHLPSSNITTDDAGAQLSAVGVHKVTINSKSTGYALVFAILSGTAGETIVIDNVHIYEVPYYQSVGNHSVTWSKVDALPNSSSDTTSLRIISTGAGDAVGTGSGNNVYIVSGANTYHSTQSTNKYTLEFWARSKGKRGTPTYTMDGTASTGWSTIKGTLTANLTISDGGTLFDSVYSFYGNHESTEHYFSRSPLTSGVTYKISYWYLIPSSNDTVNAMYQIHSGASIYEGNARLLTTTGAWTYVSTMFKASTTGLSFYLSQNSNTTITAVNDTIYIANLQIVPITQTNLHLHVQGQTKISDTLSIIPGQFEKVVFNFEANSTVADSIRIYLSQADTLWVDSLNFSQSHDLIIDGWIYAKEQSPSSTQYIAGKNMAGTVRRWGIYQNSAGIGYILSDSVTLVSNASAITANQWLYFTVIFDRTDSVILYLNGVKARGESITSLGRLENKRNGYVLGAGYDGSYVVGHLDFNGLIGEYRHTRFNNLASSTWNYGTPLATYNAYTRGAGFQDNITSGGKKIVVWYDWSVYDTVPNMLMDLSGNGYNLDQNNVGVADHVFWKR